MAISVQRAGLPDQPVSGDMVITPRIYWDETKTRLLAEGHPDARFLAYAEGTVVPAMLAAQSGLNAVEQVPTEPAPEPEKPYRRARSRQDRQIAPGVVADTSIDGEAHVLVSEPGSPLRNGVDK